MKPKKSISNHVFKSNGRYLIYCRVSTGHQGKSGLGVRSQLAICKAMANRLCLKPKVATCFSNDTENYPLEEGVFIDSGVSAYEKSALDTRPAGGRLILTADPGDTVIVSRLDRAFRSVKDFLDISQQFLQDGVRLVVCSPMIDFGTAAGNMLGSVLASFAEFESRRKSERIKDALAAKKRRLKLPGSQQKTQRKEAVLPQAWLDAQERQEIQGFTNEVTGKPGLIYIYTRVSHPNSTESGLSLEAQEDRGRKYAQWLLEVNPNLKMGIVLSDKSISAVENPLFARPCGAELNRLLKDGDQVIFPALDRGFRSIEDFSATLPIWTARGVTMHFAYENLDMNDPACRMMASMLVSLAEFEADCIRERCKAARAQAIKEGRATYGTGKYGICFHNKIKVDNIERYAVDRRKLLCYRTLRFLIMRSENPLSYEKACDRLEFLLARREKRPMLPRHGYHVRSKAARLMPHNHPRKIDGFYRREWTVNTYVSWAPRYEEALARWRKVAAERREMIRKHEERLEELRREHGGD